MPPWPPDGVRAIISPMGKAYDAVRETVEKLAAVPAPAGALDRVLGVVESTSPEVSLEAIEDAQIAASLSLNGLSKLAEEDRPYRDRVEVFPVRGDKVLGGKYPDGSFAAFGGGIDGKQRAEAAGKREVQEESGRRVEKVERLPVSETAYDWDTRSENHPGMSEAQREKIKKRIEEFRGQKTTYLVADLPKQRPQKHTDETSIKNVKMYSIDEALAMQEQAAKKARGKKREIAKGRLDALEAVKEIVEEAKEKAAAGKVYRFTDPQGQGIYEAVHLKDPEQHEQLIPEYSWLPNPDINMKGTVSHFTPRGKHEYRKRHAKKHRKIVGSVKKELSDRPDQPLYEDEFQVISKAACATACCTNSLVVDQVIEELAKEARVARKSRDEFAPGIPAKRGIYPIPEVKEDDQNQTWTASLSKHPAARRGDHLDLRLIDPQGRAHSWAFQEMPDPGKNTYAVQQPTHKKRYALRDQPFTIPEGYGATRPGEKVEPLYVKGVEVVEASDKRIRVLKHDGQQSEEIMMKRVMPALSAKQPPLWVINNATKTRSTGEGQKIPSSKSKYQETDPERISLTDLSEVMTPKIDGAHVVVDMAKDQRFMRVYSYRPTERKTGLIEHTFKFPDFQNRKSDASVNNTMIRAELWGSDRSGKAIPAEELAGILNSSVERSRRIQQEKDVTLRLTGIDVIRHGGKSYENKPFADKLEALHAVKKGTGGMIELPPIAATPEEKATMIEMIRDKKLPMTEEGVVVHDLTSSRTTKAKFRPGHDVYVKEIFTKPKGVARGHAGGFAFSWEPGGEAAGRVGTGFSHEMRKDMLENPERYVGRVATVKSQGAYQNKVDKSQLGALRAPSFQRWHLDKNDPAQMQKEGTVYHGSPKKIKELEPRADHNDDRIPPSVFASPSKSFAKTYAGRSWGDKDFEQTTQAVGDKRKVVMREMRPGAIEDIFEGASGHVYHLPEVGFKNPPRKRTVLEVVNESPVTPKRDEAINNVLETLKSDPRVELLPYDPDHSHTRDGIRRSLKRMQEMPDKGKGYREWRLKGAPRSIVNMFLEEEQRLKGGK